MENEPVCITDILGNKRWYLGYKLHRLDGPAIEFADGDKSWYLNGDIHRLDGPAFMGYNGSKNWYINSHHVTFQINKWAEENEIDLDNLTEVDKALIKLVWSDYVPET